MSADNFDISILDQSSLDDLAGLFDAYRQFYGQDANKAACLTYLQKRMERNEVIVFGVSSENTLVGFANIYPTFSSVSMRSVWTLNDLYVSHDMRQKGIANKIMQTVKEEAEKNNIAHLQLETADDNHIAQKCYETFGWQKNEFLSYYLKLGV